jgi:hypothetical protein
MFTSASSALTVAVGRAEVFCLVCVLTMVVSWISTVAVFQNAPGQAGVCQLKQADWRSAREFGVDRCDVFAVFFFSSNYSDGVAKLYYMANPPTSKPNCEALNAELREEEKNQTVIKVPCWETHNAFGLALYERKQDATAASLGLALGLLVMAIISTLCVGSVCAMAMSEACCPPSSSSLSLAPSFVLPSTFSADDVDV